MNRLEVMQLVNEAINNGLSPIVHPNGFIQLNLIDGRRMHFWDARIPRQKQPSPIHDHVFDMHSEVIAGKVLHCEIRVVEEADGYYSIYEAVSVRDAETELVNTGHRCRAEHGPWQEFGPGEFYDFPAGCFHETSDREGPAISIITKGKEFDQNPCVLVPADREPDNEFTRDAFPLHTTLGHMSTIVHQLFPISS